jgi:hypothetical protein
VSVTSRSFGFANLWRDHFIGALITSRNAGISVAHNSRGRRPWRVMEFSYETVAVLTHLFTPDNNPTTPFEIRVVRAFLMPPKKVSRL